jgi:hypothetical protein
VELADARDVLVVRCDLLTSSQRHVHGHSPRGAQVFAGYDSHCRDRGGRPSHESVGTERAHSSGHLEASYC